MEKKQGACHCRNIRYEVEIDLTKPVIECNCSYCSSKGLLLSFVPAASFTLLQGDEELTEYRFNTHKIKHEFCSDCGVQCFGQGSDADGNAMAAINIRTLDDIDLGTVERMSVDGRSR